MTLRQTRQLGIEFERRIQTIFPAAAMQEKIDTETIYSFLNQYQTTYVRQLYAQLDKAESGSKQANSIQHILNQLLTVTSLSNGIPGGASGHYPENSITFTIPNNYRMYVRSTSVTSDGKHIPNVIAQQSDMIDLVGQPNNTLRILRHPIAVLSQKTQSGNHTLTIIHDVYTDVSSVDLAYYKEPVYFDIMTSIACELPIDCFDELVEGAVELYTTYVRGGIRRQEEEGRQDRFNRRQQQKEQEQNEGQQ